MGSSRFLLRQGAIERPQCVSHVVRPRPDLPLCLLGEPAHVRHREDGSGESRLSARRSAMSMIFGHRLRQLPQIGEAIGEGHGSSDFVIPAIR
jgi:hypothetical protein